MQLKIALFLLLCGVCHGQFMPFGGNIALHSGSSPTITVTSAVCVAGTGAVTANSCTLGASGAVGDLLIVASKAAASANTATIGYSFTGTSSCTLTPVIASGAGTYQPNSGASQTFISALAACIITTSGANTPTVTWTGTTTGGTAFTDIQAFTVHTTNTWKTTFTDQTATSVAATSTTSCPTGTTSATINANDFIVANCENFTAGQTWGALTGFTQYASASRNTAGLYYKSVTSTGTQSASIPLSASDWGVGMIAAFASN